MASQVLVLSYQDRYERRTFTFTAERIQDAIRSVSRLVTETGGKFSWADAAKVHRLMKDIVWNQQQFEASRLRHYKIKVTRWATGTTLTITESAHADKFEAMRALSEKWSEQYGAEWDIDVSLVDSDEAEKIIKRMQGVFHGN